MIGRILNERYRVLAKLGEGGMGVVYLVEHVNLHRKEALKVLHVNLSESPELVARFRREARATNRLQHQNIITVYDFGQLPDGRLYLTTEYADGESLAARLRRQGHMALGVALNILAQLADAIDHAHSRGVIHRDLKPDNLVLVERRGHRDILKVLDFGIAKVIAPDYQDSVAATGPSEIFGTPAYMSPEQIEGRGTDPRIDIYAFGCIAYELAVGAPPFVGPWARVIQQQLDAPAPKPSSRRPDLPAELDAVVERCMEKNPDRRIQTGAELAAAVRNVPGFPSSTSNKNRRSRMIAVSAPDDFDGETVSEFGPGAVQNLEVAFASTLGTGENVESSLEALVRVIAETLVDLGCSDLHLAVGLAEIANIEVTLDQADVEMADIEAKSEQLEFRGREFEASLRFAISELRFECDRAVEPVSRDVADQLARLEQRSTEVNVETERELAAMTERAIVMAARKAEYEESLASHYQTLRRLIGELAPRFAGDNRLRHLVEREQHLRRASSRR